MIKALGAKAESEWLGHGEDIAMEHYDSVEDDHRKAAASRPAQVLKKMS